MPSKSEGEDAISDLLFWNGILGSYLQTARTKAGLSLRELEKRTGVSNSEICKIETGSQECRLSSFIKVCAALGIPGGLVLDQIVASSWAFFIRRVKNDARLEAFISEQWGKLSNFERDAVIHYLGVLCSVAAHLVRCSDPVRMAQTVSYPADDLALRFITFGRSVNALDHGPQRLNILSGLRNDPIGELWRHNLLSVDFLNDVVKKARAAPHPKTFTESLEWAMSAKAGVRLWVPLPADSPFAKKPSKLIQEKPPFAFYATLGSLPLRSDMTIGNWEELRSVLRERLSESGAKTAFAEAFGVSIQVLSQWLAGTSTPKGDTALRLRKRLTETESVINKENAPTVGKHDRRKMTRKARSNADEKSQSNRKKK